jgi:hypothetical protein
LLQITLARKTSTARGSDDDRKYAPACRRYPCSLSNSQPSPVETKRVRYKRKHRKIPHERNDRVRITQTFPSHQKKRRWILSTCKSLCLITLNRSGFDYSTLLYNYTLITNLHATHFDSLITRYFLATLSVVLFTNFHATGPQWAHRLPNHLFYFKNLTTSMLNDYDGYKTPVSLFKSQNELTRTGNISWLVGMRRIRRMGKKLYFQRDQDQVT